MANSAPTATVTGGHCPAANAANGTLELTLSDADGATLGLALAANSNTTLLPHRNVALDGSGNERTVRVRGAARKRGTAVLTLHVSDGTATVPVTITVEVGRRRADALRGTSGTD